jgi:hypothetical protein
MVFPFQVTPEIWPAAFSVASVATSKGTGPSVVIIFRSGSCGLVRSACRRLAADRFERRQVRRNRGPAISSDLDDS